MIAELEDGLAASWIGGVWVSSISSRSRRAARLRLLVELGGSKFMPTPKERSSSTSPARRRGLRRVSLSSSVGREGEERHGTMPN